MAERDAVGYGRDVIVALCVDYFDAAEICYVAKLASYKDFFFYKFFCGLLCFSSRAGG